MSLDGVFCFGYVLTTSRIVTIRCTCPRLTSLMHAVLGQQQVPKFFAGDMLQRVAGRGLTYSDRWVLLEMAREGGGTGEGH